RISAENRPSLAPRVVLGPGGSPISQLVRRAHSQIPAQPLNSWQPASPGLQCLLCPRSFRSYRPSSDHLCRSFECCRWSRPLAKTLDFCEGLLDSDTRQCLSYGSPMVVAAGPGCTAGPAKKRTSTTPVVLTRSRTENGSPLPRWGERNRMLPRLIWNLGLHQFREQSERLLPPEA